MTRSRVNPCFFYRFIMCQFSLNFFWNPICPEPRVMGQPTILSFTKLSHSHDLFRKFWQPRLDLLVLCFIRLLFINWFLFSIPSLYVWILREWQSYFFQFSFYSVKSWIFFSSLKYINSAWALLFYIIENSVQPATKCELNIIYTCSMRWTCSIIIL